jgi:hypothetical protein
MARRAKKGAPVGLIIGIVAAIVIVGVASALFLNRTKDPFTGLTDLNIKDFMENANSLSGNVYRLEGIVEDKLRWTPTKGQLIAIQVNDESIPVLVPSEFNDVNIARDDRFTMKVEVRSEGKIIVLDLAKS